MAPSIKPGQAPLKLVHEGADGWLFLQGGSNFVTSLYHRDGGNLPDTRLTAWRDLIEKRIERCNALGIACAHIVVPDKLTIYGDRQGAPIVDPDQSPALRLAEQMALSPAAGGYVDLVAPMRAQRDANDLYWRTDSHWTPEGCDVAYRTLCDRLALQADEGLLARPCKKFKAVLDLGAHVAPLPWEDVREYDFAEKSHRVWINRVTSYLEDPSFQEEIHVGARARFVNRQAPNQQSALLFGNSYAGPNAEALTGMLAETCQSLEFVWSSSVDWSLVKARKPDILIFEIAERFLALLPQDRRPLWLLELKQVLLAQRRRLERRYAASKVGARA